MPFWIFLPPLFTSAVLLFFGRRLKRASGWLGCASVAVGFIFALVALWNLWHLPSGSRAIEATLYNWISTGDFNVAVRLRLDELSAVMAAMVCGVGFVIHVYSVEYMKDDPAFHRFFAYMNLFVASMLLLLMSDNLLLMFAGWEGVGLCSYLLIGFWSDKPAAAASAKKAFLTTRLGDTGFMIGLFVLFAATGTLDIGGILNAARGGSIAESTAMVASLLLFAGAVGKSAQVPLHVWLPDAMEGPTPVSALIHAATMVTAGVYLVVRLHPVFELSPIVLSVVTIVGLVTALFGAIAATAEPDIKRVLAFSTASQLGFMFVAAGLGAYSIAIFHLLTHATFKALLFLSAGSVMHGLGDETALDRMGGLRRAMPATFALSTVGWVAITGLLPISGFFSKDAVVASTAGRPFLLTGLVVATALTAFYMSRWLLMTFAGRPRFTEGTHPHESRPGMLVPMAILAVAAVVASILNLPSYLPFSGLLDRFFEGVFGPTQHHSESWVVPVVLWVVSVAALLIARAIYSRDDLSIRDSVRSRLGPIYMVVRARFYIDEIYSVLVIAPARLVASLAAFIVDPKLIDGIPATLASAVAGGSTRMRKIQSGAVRLYAVSVAVGAAAACAWLVRKAIS